MTGGNGSAPASGLRCYAFAALSRLGIRHGSFARHGGASAPPYAALNCAVRSDDPRTADNRQRVFAALGLDPGRVVYASGCHSCGIAVADDVVQTPGEMNVLWGKDGVIARRPGLVLALCVADCLPVFFAAPAAGAVGLIHAGWRGVHEGILPAAVDLFRRRYGARPGDLTVAFGPAIRRDAYRAQQPSQLGDPRWQPYLTQLDGGSYLVDFVSMARQQLLDAGIEPGRLLDCGICTAARNDEFFSCHREGYLSGRFFNYIAVPPSDPAAIERTASQW